MTTFTEKIRSIRGLNQPKKDNIFMPFLPFGVKMTRNSNPCVIQATNKHRLPNKNSTGAKMERKKKSDENGILANGNQYIAKNVAIQAIPLITMAPNNLTPPLS
ncbi:MULTISPECIES: hypothetical protein [Pontibacillus]|uniref:Uncharacterized protein n=1 Tax=Pontibacillus chungwhensis TaxID=265426 RepID=A0ABY8UXQ1_9BACI|nr:MULTISPECIES: hypothetical protein [Pontibacillus]WIF96416.1 hypothetical protein QNI29_11690 [Pontibacillus chungwhensis]